MSYYGSMSCKLKTLPQCGTSCATQVIVLLISQGNNLLVEEIIRGINDLIPVEFSTAYKYNNFLEPIDIIFKTSLSDDQFNRENPVEVSDMEFDGIFLIPHITMSGQMKTESESFDPGNVLFCNGELCYTITLPIANLANSL